MGKQAGDRGGAAATEEYGQRVAPGKATRVGEIDGGDVSEAARAEVGAAFGGRAHGVEYGIGGGAAEARGANAVAIGGRVDFAPGKFDLESGEGRARLGEETAHAVQQGNQGETASEGALEREAKLAGNEFAAGRIPRVELAAPAGLALADDPQQPAPKDTDKSTEVPDLQNGEVDAIKKAIAAGDKDEALRVVLKALQRIDATQFKSDDLEDGKLHSGRSKTSQGAKFEAWLKTYLDGVAAAKKKATSKLKDDEVAKAIKDAKPAAADKDIKVQIGHFASVPQLYSTVRHEFIHVQQLRKDYLAHINRYVMPAGLSPPDFGTLADDREVEAYLWEMEHLADTGLQAPGDLKLLWKECSNAFLKASAKTRKTYDKQFKAAFKAVWQKAMDGHIAAIATHHKAFTTAKTVAEPGKVEMLRDDMEEMWINREKFDNPWAGTTASHKTALDQATEMIAWIQSDRFTKLLDVIDQEVKTGYTNPDDPISRREKLRSGFNDLDAAGKTALRARFEATGPVLWEKTFDALEVEVRRRIKMDDLDVAQEFMNNSVKDLFDTADKGVKTAAFQDRRKTLQAEITAAKKPKPKQP